jgi:hypothetical protein
LPVKTSASKILVNKIKTGLISWLLVLNEIYCVIVFISIHEESDAPIMRNTHVIVILETLSGAVSLGSFSSLIHSADRRQSPLWDGKRDRELRPPLRPGITTWGVTLLIRI